MVLVLVVAHVMLTLPAFVINLIHHYTSEIDFKKLNFAKLLHVVVIMFFANAAVNPFLYGIFNTNFQKSFRICPCVNEEREEERARVIPKKQNSSKLNSIDLVNQCNRKSIIGTNRSQSQGEEVFLNKNFVLAKDSTLSGPPSGSTQRHIQRHSNF